MKYPLYSTILIFAIEQMRVIKPIATVTQDYGTYRENTFREFKMTGFIFIDLESPYLRIHMKAGSSVFNLSEISQVLPFEYLPHETPVDRFAIQRVEESVLFAFLEDLQLYGLDHLVAVITANDETRARQMFRIPREDVDPVIFKLKFLSS